AALEHVQREMQSHRVRRQEVRVRQARIRLPGVLELERLEPEPGPALLEAQPHFRETLVDAVGGYEQGNGHDVVAGASAMIAVPGACRARVEAATMMHGKRSPLSPGTPLGAGARLIARSLYARPPAPRSRRPFH